MSNSKLVCYTKLSPYTYGKRNHAIDTISIHCMAGNLSVESCGQMFQTSKSSSNYGIGSDGRIGMYVEEGYASWCTSNRSNDNRAVTIEVANCAKGEPWPITEKAYKSLIELLVDICKRNHIPELRWKGDQNLVGQVDRQNMTVHRWFANKSCPGDWMYARMGDLAKKVTAALGNQAPASLDNAPAAWSKDAVNWALENRLLLGDSNGNLKLRENLTREQFCVMLKRYHDMIQK